MRKEAVDTLSQIMRYCRNYFIESKESGTFTIESGVIKPLDGVYQVSQYVRIVGGVLNRDSVVQIERVGEGYIDVSIHDADYPQWIQPAGGHDAYQIGDRVTHKYIRYVSQINANIWEPGTDPRWWHVVGDVEHATRDETFTGAIVGLAIPPDFLFLVDEISAFQERIAQNPNSRTYTSESFSNWSGTRATNGKGMVAGWQDVFSGELNKYRKMWDEVIL